MSEYYCAFDKGIGYGEWKIFTVDQYEKVRRMNDEEVKEVCGVNPNILSLKCGLKWTGDIGDWGKQTYAKDEGEEPFTLEGLQKLWKAIHKEKKLKKEKREGMKIILENVHTGKKRQYNRGWTHLKIGDRILLDNKDYKVIKVIKQKGVVYSEFVSVPLNWKIPDFMKGMLKAAENPNSIFFYHRKAGKNVGYRIAEAHTKMVKKEAEKKALTEFHKRPYFKTVVREVKGKPRGEENLEKMMFPCYCTHNAKTDGYSGYGMIITCLGIKTDPEYMLIDIGKQRNELTSIASDDSLEVLIRKWNIEICKGETKVWREVREYTKKKE